MTNLFNRLDTYLLSQFQRRRLSLLTRLLYHWRRDALCWHVTASGRVVMVPVRKG